MAEEPHEPEPEPERAPWLTDDGPAGAPAPQPVKVKRKMSRLERTLRGKRKDEDQS